MTKPKLPTPAQLRVLWGLINNQVLRPDQVIATEIDVGNHVRVRRGLFNAGWIDEHGITPAGRDAAERSCPQGPHDWSASC